MFSKKQTSLLHNGFALINVLIGLALSMIAATALLVTYKLLISSATDAAKSAKLMDLSATNSVMLGRLLSQAGWGMVSAASQPGGQVNKDIILISNAKISNSTLSGTKIDISSTPQKGQAVAWDSKISESTQCSALVIANEGITLLGPVGCQSIDSDWSSLTWAPQIAVNGEKNFPNLSFTVIKTTCWPFGGGPGPQPAVQVTLTGINSAATTTCILNIPN